MTRVNHDRIANAPADLLPEPAPATLVAPVASGERIHVLDILRGFALLGMILVHFHQFMETDTAGIEGLIGWFTWIGVEAKAWGTFAFLFGVGFAVLLRGFDARGRPILTFYLRRLAGLAVFGFIAEAFFGFHVLLEYAIWGVPLLFVRRLSSRVLLIIALLAVASGLLILAVRAANRAAAAEAMASAPAVENAMRPDPAAVLRAAREGDSYLALLEARLSVMRAKYSHWTTFMPGANFALFIIGLLACRRGIFDEPRRHRRLILGWMAFGFTAWCVSWVLFALPLPPPAGVASATLRSGFGLIHDQWLTFTYVGALVLLVAYRPAWQTRLSLIGGAGRMALTNYMLQVAALDVLASNYGAALRVRPLLSVLGTLLLFGALAVFSRWWLAHFRFGPAEWLWRCFTYLRVQPLRRDTAPEQAANLS